MMDYFAMYMVGASYFIGLFTGRDDARGRLTLSEAGWNVLCGMLWPLGLFVLLTPRRWWARLLRRGS